mmetsp:Transcript_53155/g.65157  ORF Transcript_53155/g.65157 Transcript_53155/m.65157 type:complete len:234 (+) Transcript_53155:178-879(+)
MPQIVPVLDWIWHPIQQDVVVATHQAVLVQRTLDGRFEELLPLSVLQLRCQQQATVRTRILHLATRERLAVRTAIDAGGPIFDAFEASFAVGDWGHAVDGRQSRTGVCETEELAGVHACAVHENHAGRVHFGGRRLGREHIEVAGTLIDPMQFLETGEVPKQAHTGADEHSHEHQETQNHLVTVARAVFGSDECSDHEHQHQWHNPQHGNLSVGSCNEVTHHHKGQEKPGKQD